MTDTTKNSGSEILQLRQNNAFLEGLVTELRVLLRDANECLSDASYVKAEDKVRYEQLVRFAKEQETEIERMTSQVTQLQERAESLLASNRRLSEANRECWERNLQLRTTAIVKAPKKPRRKPTKE